MSLVCTIGILLTFVVWLNYEKNKTSGISQKATEMFWDKESRANQIKRKSLDQLDYITLPERLFPLLETTDETLINFQAECCRLSEQKIVNFTGISNTDLKLAYGAPNLPLLMEYDKNFTLLARLCVQWSEYLISVKKDKEALILLEFGVECKTDISKHYTLLASLYQKEKETAKIHSLIEVAESLNSLMKKNIVNSLKAILAD